MEKLKQLISATFKKHRKIVFVAIILAILGFWGWRTFISPRALKPQYQTAQVERGTVISSVSASGLILSSNVMNVTTEATGVVKQVFISDGNRVIKGDKIAEIELDSAGQQQNASAWSSYLSANNSVDSANVTTYTLRSAKDTTWKKFYDLAANSTYQNTDGTPKDDIRNSSAEFQSLQADWLAAESKYKNQQGMISQSQAALNNAWLSYQ